MNGEQAAAALTGDQIDFQGSRWVGIPARLNPIG